MTPSAVSHQIRQLEKELNVKLVRREGRRIALTESGEMLIPALRTAFWSLTAAVADVHEHETTAPLRVSMLQNFAVNWFMPRLCEFEVAFPEIEVQLSFEPHYVDFAQDPVDLAIRHSPQRWPRHHCELLFQDQLIPACSKAYLADHGPFQSPADLLRHSLLVSSGRPADAWAQWFQAFGIRSVGNTRTIRVDSSHMAMQAAANGIGFAIAGIRLMQPMILRGDLVFPFCETVPEHGSYYTVCPRAWANRSKVRRMRYWLAEEARRPIVI